MYLPKTDVFVLLYLGGKWYFRQLILNIPEHGDFREYKEEDNSTNTDNRYGIVRLCDFRNIYQQRF